MIKKNCILDSYKMNVRKTEAHTLAKGTYKGVFRTSRTFTYH